MAQPINLNADLGESVGVGNDEALLELVGAASIACGFHAGDAALMRRTVQLAQARGVGIGAHPSYPDLEGFGRRPMSLPDAELEAIVLYQIAALAGIARAEGARLTHVKPHGALSNQAAVDRATAEVICRAMVAFDQSLILLAPALSTLAETGRAAGIPTVEEIFADRAYLDDGQLVPRSRPDAMIHGAEASLAHVVRMFDEGALVSVTGKRLPVRAQSICVHGDGPEAVATARRLRQGLAQRGHRLVTLPELIG